LNTILKNWTTIFFFILALIIGWYVSNKFSDSKIRKLEKEVKSIVLKNDSLVLLEKGLYSKLVADTATAKQLKRKVEELQLELENPKLVIKQSISFDTLGTVIDVVKEAGDSFKFVDYYPTKENYFIMYSAKVNTKEKKGKGKFTLSSLSFSLGIEEQVKGMYRLNVKVPDFAKVSKLDVISLPSEKRYKKDSFGFIFGAGFSKSFETDSQFLQMSTGIRINKTYLFINAGTNQTIGASLMLEF
jgi:hypothetical protein